MRMLRDKRGVFPAIGAGVILALSVGIPVFIGLIKAIFGKPSTTNPPLWVIALIAVVIIVLLKK